MRAEMTTTAIATWAVTPSTSHRLKAAQPQAHPAADAGRPESSLRSGFRDSGGSVHRGGHQPLPPAGPRNNVLRQPRTRAMIASMTAPMILEMAEPMAQSN